MSMPYTNIGGLTLPTNVSIFVDCLTGFVAISLFASCLFIICYTSILLKNSYRSFKQRLNRGYATPNALPRITDHYAMLVKYSLLLTVSITEFATFLFALFERSFILLYVDLKNISHVNQTCALDRITPHLYNNFPYTGILVSLSSIAGLIFLFFLVIFLKYLYQYYSSKCREVRFRYYRTIIATLISISLFPFLLLYQFTFFFAYFFLLISLVSTFTYVVHLLIKIYKELRMQTIILKENTYEGEENNYRRQFKMLKNFKRLSIFVYIIFSLFLYTEVIGHFSILYKLVIYQLCQKSEYIAINQTLFAVLKIIDEAMEYTVMSAFLLAGLGLILPYFAYVIVFKICIPLKIRIFGSGQRYRFTPQYYSPGLTAKFIDN